MSSGTRLSHRSVGAGFVGLIAPPILQDFCGSRVPLVFRSALPRAGGRRQRSHRRAAGRGRARGGGRRPGRRGRVAVAGAGWAGWHRSAGPIGTSGLACGPHRVTSKSSTLCADHATCGGSRVNSCVGPDAKIGRSDAKMRRNASGPILAPGRRRSPTCKLSGLYDEIQGAAARASEVRVAVALGQELIAELNSFEVDFTSAGNMRVDVRSKDRHRDLVRATQGVSL